jgi:hypothetical protein
MPAVSRAPSFSSPQKPSSPIVRVHNLRKKRRQVSLSAGVLGCAEIAYRPVNITVVAVCIGGILHAKALDVRVSAENHVAPILRAASVAFSTFWIRTPRTEPSIVELVSRQQPRWHRKVWHPLRTNRMMFHGDPP